MKKFNLYMTLAMLIGMSVWGCNPLQLDEIANSRNKVTLGFKCSPQLKTGLAQEA